MGAFNPKMKDKHLEEDRSASGGLIENAKTLSTQFFFRKLGSSQKHLSQFRLVMLPTSVTLNACIAVTSICKAELCLNFL